MCGFVPEGFGGRGTAGGSGVVGGEFTGTLRGVWGWSRLRLSLCLVCWSDEVGVPVGDGLQVDWKLARRIDKLALPV